MRKILTVDTDMVVVDTGATWNSWIADYLRCEPKELYEGCPYDLREMYDEELSERPSYYRGDLMKFWEGHYTYDLLKPVAGSVCALERACLDGWDIIFASEVLGNHHKSKKQFLEKNFPYLSAFLATDDKHYIRCDAIIEDRQDILSRMPSGVTRIRRWTPYKQEVTTCTSTKLMVDWGELRGLL